MEALTESAFLPRIELVQLGVPRTRVDEALESLRARGFEITRRGARIAVTDQLRKHLAVSSLLPMRSIEAFVEGATRREVVAAAGELIAGGEAITVVRSTEIFLGSKRSETLSAKDLTRLRSALGALARAASLAARKGGHLLRVDVAEALSGLGPELGKVHDAQDAPGSLARGAERAGGTRASDRFDADIEDALASLRGSSGLVFVPRLVRELGGSASRSRVHAALREGAARGRLELRPESGMGRLSEDEKADCLKGPAGSLLSWVRDLEVRP